LDQWGKYAGDDVNTPTPILPIKPTAEDVKIITQRMYDKHDQRRALGMMARKIVQKSFSGERYLREHEQMLWVGKSRYESYGIKSAQQEPSPSELRELSAAAAALGGGIPGVRTYAEVVDAQLEKMAHPRPPWPASGAKPKSSGGTSFTSLYTEAPADRMSMPASSIMRNGPGNYGPDREGGKERGDAGQLSDIARVKRTNSGKLSFQARSKEREGTAGKGSQLSSGRYVPSTLSEVHNASDVKKQQQYHEHQQQQQPHHAF
jgi:hypothetical protein